VPQSLPDFRRRVASEITRLVLDSPYFGVCHLLVLQVFGLIFAYAAFAVFDINNPDGITVPPSFGSLAAFAAIMCVLTFILVLALGTHRLFGSREWDALGATFIVFICVSMVWYRAILMPSPYITSAMSDHFTYLNEAFEMLRPHGGIELPGIGYASLSDFGYPLTLAVLLQSFGATSFFPIATNAFFVCGATICVMHLYLRRHEKRDSAPGAMAGWISLFQVLPLAILTAGAILKDSLVLFGVALAITAFYEATERRSPIAYLLMTIGIFIVLLGRVAHGVAVMATFLLFFASARMTARRAASMSLVVIAGVVVAVWAAKSGLLVLQDASSQGLATRIAQPFEGGPMHENLPSSFIYRLTHPFGDSLFGQCVALPLVGGVSWFVPFPFVQFDYQVVLNTPQAVANMISLTLLMASWGAIKEAGLRLWRRHECFPVDRLMFMALVVFFIATAMSQTPIARYRMPFDMLVLYFLFSQPKVGRAIRRAIPVVVMLAVAAHLLYYSKGGG
jgi:hypothetical protein